MDQVIYILNECTQSSKLCMDHLLVRLGGRRRIMMPKIRVNRFPFSIVFLLRACLSTFLNNWFNIPSMFTLSPVVITFYARDSLSPSLHCSVVNCTIPHTA